MRIVTTQLLGIPPVHAVPGIAISNGVGSLLVAFHDLAELVLNDNGLPLLDLEPSCAHESSELEILQLLISSLESHFDD